MEEESDISGEEDNVNDALLSVTQNQVKVTQTTIMSKITESPEIGQNGIIKTYFILMKGFIGIGILYIPFYYKPIGYVISTGILLLISLIVFFGLSRLIECRAKTKVAYPTIAELACGSFLRLIVGLLLFAGPMMYGTAYLAYIISNSVSMIMYDSEHKESTENKVLDWSIGSLLVILVAPLMCIRRPDRFYHLFIISSIVVILALVGFTVPKAISIKAAKFDAYGDEILFKTLAGFTGICLFSFEGYGIVIPSHQQMSARKYFTHTFAICIASVWVFYGFFGLLTSIEAGKEISNAVTFSVLVKHLGFSSPWAIVLCSIYMSCLIPGYMLTMYPSMRLAEKALGYVSRQKGKKLWVQNTARVLLVAATVAAAVVWGRQFDKALVAIGFFVCVPLVIVIPAFSHLRLAASGAMSKFFDVVLSMVGIGLVAVGVMYFVQ